MAIMFPPGLREFIEVWVGANVATGNEDLGFDSRNPYKRLADDVRDLSDAMKGAISTAGNSLPPRIAGEFVAAMKLFVDDNGHNHLQKFSDELRDLGSRQVDRSIKLSEAKYQILLEFILMNIELALIAALAVFTGGTSLTEIAIQKARTALTILLLLQRLGRAVPTPLSVLLEAIQEAFVSFASQLISMTAPDDPERRRVRFDWKDIGQSAVAGAFAGLFGGIFGQVGGKFINKYFKNNHFWKEASELPFTFVNEGQAETFAEAFTGLVFLGTFTLNPGTFLSAGLSGLVFEAASTGAEFGGKFAYEKFFRNLDFGPDGVNDLPGGGNRYGNGNRYGHGNESTGRYEYEDRHDTTYDGGNTYRDIRDDTYNAPYVGGNTYRNAYDDTYDDTYDDSASSVGDTGDTASVFSDTSDVSSVSSVPSVTSNSSVSSVSSVSSLPDYGTVYGAGAYGLQGATGADKPSYSTPSPNAQTNAYTNANAYRGSFPDDPDDPDTDTVFSALTPSVTAGTGTDRSADTGNGLPVDRPATVGSAVPGPSPSRTGDDSVPDGTGRQRSADDDTTRFTSEGRQQPDPQAPLAPLAPPTPSTPASPGHAPQAPASPGHASPNAAPQQRPQTAPSGDPAVAVEPSDPVPDPLAPEESRTPSPGDSERSGPSSAVPKAETARPPSDTPSPYRSVRTESEELPAGADSPADPAPAVSREVPHTRPGAVDETPLGSRAPAEIPTGNPSGPGSPDSVDMIMDWEDGRDDSGSEPDPVPDLAPDPVTEALYDRLLTDVFGPAIGTNPLHPALRDALTHLDQLRQADPALRNAPLDLDDLTRRVLLLDPAHPVTDAQRGELFRVALDPAVESAGSLAALAAFHLELRGALSATHALTADDGGVLGRNWTDAAIPGLDLTEVGKAARQPDGTLGRGDVRPAPWHRPGEPGPYVVMAEGDHERIVVRGYDGAPRQVPLDVFAELLARDPRLAGLPPGTPVVLLVPGAGARGLDLPRRAADRAGRDVWSADGTVKVSPQRDPSQPYVVSLLYGEGLPRADWIRSTPGQVLDPAEYANAPAWEREVRSHSVVTDGGATIGRGVFEDSEAPRRIAALRLATESSELWHHDPATGESVKDDDPVPFAGKPVYVFGAHARPGATRVPTTTDPRHHTRQRETGAMLKRRPSLARLPADHAVLMEACSSAKPPGVVRTRRGIDDTFVPDPLAAVSESQHVANETGRTTYGGTHMVSFATLPDGTFVHRLYTDSRGRRGRWVEHRPEPTGALLDDRARAAGLHTDPERPVTDATRERTLRLVRALRLAFGAAIEDDGRYGDLLAGIGALETLRAADPVLGGLGPFSMDLFERAAHARRPDGTGPDAYRDLLTDAADAVHRGPGTVLSDFVTLPHVTAAARRLGALPEQDLDAEAARVLRLDGGPAAVGGPERARLFWATVKALEWESRTPDPDTLTGRILHLEQPDPSRRPDLLDLVARAAAVGVDVDDPTELGAFHLETLGALSSATQLRDAGGAPVGRHWAQAPPHATMATDRVVVAAPKPGGGYRPVSQERPPWSAPGGPSAYTVWAGGDRDHLLMNLPGGFRARVPYEEVAELLARDPVLNTRPADGTDIVLAVSKAAPSTGPGTAPDTDPRAVVSAGTGRAVWASRGNVALAATGPSRPYVPTLLPTVPGRPAAADWSAVRPGDPTAPGARVPTGGTGADDVTFADRHGSDAPPAALAGLLDPGPVGGLDTPLPSLDGLPAGFDAPLPDHRDDGADGDRAQEPAPEEARYRELPADVHGPGILSDPRYPALRDGLARLDRLRPVDPLFGPTPLDLDRVARTVLLLDHSAPVSDAQRGELLRVATDPAAESAGSLAALTALHLRRQGVLSPTHAMTTGLDGRPRGRDWTTAHAPDLDLTNTGRTALRSDGTLERGEVTTAPWHRPGEPEPYVVRADGDHEHIVVRGHDGAPREVPLDVFAELLALDPELAGLPTDVPVVLLVPGAGARGLELPRRAADRAGRDVWSADGGVDVNARQDPSLPHVVSLRGVRGGPRPHWIRSTPGQVPDPAQAADAPLWEQWTLSHTIVTDRGPIGRGVFRDTEHAQVLEDVRHATTATDLHHHDRVSGKWTKDDRPVPFAGKPVYVFAAHGLPGETRVPTLANPDHSTRQERTGGMLKRRPSLARLPADHAVVMEACFSAAPPGLIRMRRGVHDLFAPDPLGAVSESQHVANETGRTVYGGTHVLGFARRDGKVVHQMVTDSRGRRGRWVEHRPEPTGALLDDRARAAGLHTDPVGPAPEAVRERTLRLVRALRLTFGAETEDDSRYGELLRGIGALDAMRHADPALRDVVPFSLDLFERAAREIRATEHADVDGEPGPDAYRDLLARAADVVTLDPGAVLTGFVTLPHVTNVAEGLAGLPEQDVNDEAAHVLGLDPDRAVIGEPERARLFWATVKALEWESRTPDPVALTGRVLHLDRPDPSRVPELLDLVARAAAAGVDLDDLTELAAFHLELLGALSPDTLLSDDEGAPAGRRWVRGSSVPKVDADSALVMAATRDGGHRPLYRAKMPWTTGTTGPTPYLVWAETGATHLTMDLPGGSRVRVPYEEVAELLARDPGLNARPQDADIVLASSPTTPVVQPAPEARSVLGTGTGRGVWTSPGATGLLAQDDPERPHVLALLPLGDGARQRDRDWSVVRPAPRTSTSTPGTTLAAGPADTTTPVPGVTPSTGPVSTTAAATTVTTTTAPPPPPPPSPDAPRLDPAMAPPPRRRTPVRFPDGRRMPAYVDDLPSLLPSTLTAAETEQLLASPGTFGQSTVVLRGLEETLDTLGRELERRPDARPADGARLLDDVRRTLRDKPKTLADGEGRPFPYVTADGKRRVLWVGARHHGNWAPFDDGIGDSTKIDSMHRAAATFGLTKNMQANSQYGLGGPIGPAGTAAFGGFGRLALRFGFINKVGYTLTDQRMNQMETRTLDKSRAFLDDIHYEFRVTDPAGRVVTGIDPGPGTAPGPGTDPAVPARFSFGVRRGLMVRLPDSVTKIPKPGRIPRSITLDRDSQYRFVRIEGFGPVAAIRDWAARQIGVLPGSSAYTELDVFFSGDSFQRHGGTMARGRVTTPPLFADDKKKSPLGVFVVEEVIPRTAILVGETDQAEMRDINTTTVRSERSRADGRSLLLQAVAGPAFNFFDPGTAPFDLRLQFGPTAQYSYARTWSAGLGGAGTLKSAGQVKGPKTALYLVVKSVRVRRAGDNAPPTRFLTWSLDRMTSSEARRLAGWDDGTALALRNGAAPPFVPPYLTVDRPRTLGMHRVKEFTFDDGLRTRVTPDAADGVGRTLLDAFADGVVDAVSNLNQDLVVPLDQLLPPNPPKGWRTRFDDLLRRKPDQVLRAARSLPVPPRWTDPVKYRIALQNTLQILGVLSQQSVTANLEALTTVGLPVRLRDPDSVGTTYYTLLVHGTLTGRRYEGKDVDEGMRFSAQGVDRIDGQTSAKRGVDLGFEGTFSGRDNDRDEAGLTRNTLGLTLGARQGWQRESETGFGSTVTNEPMSVTNKPTHLYRYDLALTASLSGHWRPRGLIRGLGLGLPGLLVLDEPVNVLFGRTPRGHLRGGGPMTGQVLIGVPVQHTPDADPHADGALNPYLSDEPAPTPMTTERALALAKGDLVLPAGTDTRQPAGRLADRGTPQFKEFRQHPFVIVNVVLSPTLTAEVDRVLRTASGSAWQLVKEGAPTRDAIVRTFTPQYLTSSFDQSSGPLGLVGSGLLGKGPYGELWGTFRYTTTVGNLRALTPPMSMDTEMTLGGGRQAAGKTSTGTAFVFGGQLVYSVARNPGHGLMGAYGVVANPVSRTGTRSLSVVRTVVADMNRKGFTHQVLVAGDVQHWFALFSSRLGTGRVGAAAAGSALVPGSLAGAAGTALTSPGGLLGHLPEKSAHRMGLIDDGLGDVPRYTSQVWTPQPWMRGAAFGTYAVNALDPTDVLLAFDKRIGRLGLDDESRERIRQLVTGRATRALKGEMTTTGPSTLVKAGGWGWDGIRIGSRRVRARVELIPGTPVFDGLDHSAELEENRRAIETAQQNSEFSAGADLGFLTSQTVYTGSPQVPAAGPTYTEGGSNRKTVASSHTVTTVTIYRAASTEPHAEVVTPYRMRITLEADDTPHTGAPADPDLEEAESTALDRFRGRLRIVEEDDVGELREHVPLSLMEPAPSSTGADGTGTSGAGRRLPAPDPAADPALAGPPRPVPLSGVEEKLTVRDGDGVTRSFTFPENGMHPRGIIGIENIRTAGDLLLTKAYDVGFSLRALEAEDGPDDDALTDLLRRTRETGLTRLGTGSAQALEDGTSSTAVTAFFPRTTEPDGYQVAGLTEKSLVGTDTGQLSLRSAPDFSRALLLTVADGKKLEVLRRYGDNAGTSSSVEHSQSSSLGGAFLYDSPNNAGLNQIGAFGPGPNDLDGDVMPVGDDHLTSRNLKPKTGRSFLFAVPATWIGVGDVHRGIVDSRLANRIRGGTLAKARSGPQAMESEAYVVTWIREDVARELRIITDTNFPERVSKAWDAVESASKAWVDADKAYWKKRRASGGLRADLDAAQASLDKAAGTARAAARPVDLARTGVEDADRALTRAEADARRDHGIADADVAAAQAEADALADDEYAQPEHDGWAEFLRDEQDAALARLADAEEAAGTLRKAADLRLETARTEKALADGRLDAALLSARAPGRALDEATARRDTARDALDTRRAELEALRAAAEKAAAEYHRVRAGTDQLTRWHRLAATEEGRKELDGLAEPPAVTYQAPPKKPVAKPAAPPRYTRSGEAPDTVLTSPTGETYTLHDVPEDGDAFFRALAEGLERAAPGLPAAHGIDLTGPRAMSEMRRRVASWLTDHADEDLLAVVAPDHTDTFSAEEIAAAGLDLGTDTPARREFDGLGGLIPHVAELSPEVRAELAITQLLRRGDAPSEAGWNHAASDLLPLLAARTFGVRVTVVGSDGGFQDFAPGDPTGTGSLRELVGPSPHSGAHVVLSLDDRHYRLALPTTGPLPKDGDPSSKGADSSSKAADPLPPEEALAPAPKSEGALDEGTGALPKDGDPSSKGADPSSKAADPLPPEEPLPPAPKAKAGEPASRPSDVPPRGDGEKGSGTESDSGRARGRRVPVPGTGECLLYSFMAGDPVHIRGRLGGLAATDRAAYDLLGDPDAVRAELRRQAGSGTTAGPARAALRAMRSYVEDYVGRSAGRLHPQIVGQFRQTVADEFTARVRGTDRAGMLALLARHGVRHVPVPEALDPAELLRRYVDARTASRPADPGVSPRDARAVVAAEAEDLSPRQMFEHLERHDLLPTPDDLDDEALRRLLATAYTQSTAPLDDAELSTLLDAVVHWERRWGTPAGEVFLPLLAHAFDLRVDVVRSLPSGARRVGGAGPDNATRQTEVYYNGSDHYDGSDAGARDRFGDAVLPKRIKDEERDEDGDVRLNPLWVPLDEVDPDLLITGNRDAVWLYTVTDDGRVVLGTEDLSGIVTPEQFDALLAGMREKDPDLTAESLRKTLDGLGHTGIAAGFADDGGRTADPTAGPTAGRTLPGRSRVSGEFRWSAKLRSWVVNDKSGRYMSESVRPGLDAAEAADWLTNVAALFSDRLGVVVRTDQVKTAASVPAPPPAPEPGSGPSRTRTTALGPDEHDPARPVPRPEPDAEDDPLDVEADADADADADIDTDTDAESVAVPDDDGPAGSAPALSPSPSPSPSSSPAPSRVAFEHRHRDVTDPDQRRRLADLAERIVLSGLRDLRAGLRLPGVMVTGYSNGPRFALSGGAVEHADTVGRQRAETVRDFLLDEIRRQLERNEPAVRDIAEVRGGTVRAEDFPVTTRSGGRDIGAVGPIDGATGRAARRQAVITIDRSPLSEAAARLAELSPEDFGRPDYFTGPDRLARNLLHLDDNPGDDPDSDDDSDSDSDSDSGSDSDTRSESESGSDGGSAASAPAPVRFDVDDLSHRVRRLYELADAAMAAGRATSRASLTAYHLGRQGLLSDATRLTAPDGTPLGRNWTGRPTREVDVSSYDVVDGDDRAPRPSPWARRPDAPLPYVVGTKDGDHTKVGLTLPDRSRRWRLSPEEFAELLAQDQELTGREEAAEVVLVSPNAGAMGLDLPRRASARTGRTLWAHSGEVALKPHPDTGRHRVEVTDDRNVGDESMGESAGELMGEPVGEWIASGPDDLGPDGEGPEPGEGVLRTIDGRTLRDADVKSVTLTDEGRPVGRAVVDGADLLRREPWLQDLTRSTEWSVYDPVTGEPIGNPRPVPWKGRDPYFFVVHGLPGQTLMVERMFQNNVPVRGTETGGYLRRRPSVSRLDRDTPLVFLSCWGSGPEGHTAAALKRSRPFVPDPLAVTSAAQDVSNSTRRDVYAPDREHWSRYAHGKLYDHGIPTTPANDPVDMVRLRPEPTPDALDDLAARAGLETSPDLTPAMARDTALRLVRALRTTFGVDVEKDKDDPDGTYHRLLRGIGALEVMRRRDEDLREHGELTLDLLDRVTRAHHGLTTAPGTRPAPPGPDDVRTMLEAASARLSADPRSTLPDFVPLSSVDRARELIGRHGTDRWARQVLGLHPSEQVTAAHRQNALWATVKAVESVENHPDPDALTAKVLHLDTGVDPRDEALRADLLRTAATAAALGRDAHDPTVLAAYDLERNGALDDRTLITSVNGAVTGRSWAGRTAPSRMWADRYVISPDGGLAGSRGALAPWHREGAGKSAHPGAYVLDMNGTTPGRLDMPRPDGTTRPVPYEEIAELLSHDPVLARLDRDVTVVPVGTGEGDAGLAEAIAARTGAARTVWLPTRPLRLLDRRPAVNESLLVLTSPQDDTGAHWSRTRPPALPDPDSGPAPDVIAADDDTVPEAPLSEAPPSEAPPSEEPPQAPPSEDARRWWVAGQVGVEDLPGSPPGFTGTEIVTLAELRDAGVEITPGMDVEAQLGGGVRGSGLAPRDQVRLLLARPGPWPGALDAVAATVSRRLWRSALTDFGSTAPDPDAARAARAAWDTALGLLLPGERDSALADWRYAGDAFRDAVRRLAVLLAAEGTDPRTVARLAARLREGLGLPPPGTSGPGDR
ncbi:lonely Cys domain-containing protein [Streptomyces sp. NPDC014882]|uniref:lonely Cys domain-containing protein n=1 Tax=Streptomyces sp. NPDC014882 TaxID=3364927 RepID=UPI0036FF9DA2